jgi:enoyl-CoA hydratase
MDPIQSERRGSVTLLTLSRPAAMNALDTSTLRGLLTAVRAVANDDDTRAVVISGEGRAFAAGADIAEMKDHGVAEAEEFSRLGHEAFSALEALPIPTIAAVNGFALGGGCELACACDWIYASTKARFGQPEVNLGLIPGFGGTSRLARRVGMAWAKELVLSGEPIDAETALRIGLANRLFDPDTLLEASVALGETIAKKGPLAVAAAKRIIQEGHGADVRVAHELERSTFAVVAGSADAHEGKAAFLERREPNFSGR